MSAAAIVGLGVAVLVAFFCLLILARVSATRRNLKGLSATLTAFQSKSQDYLQSLAAGLSAVERTLVLIERQRSATPAGSSASAADVDRIRLSLQMVSSQLSELASAQAERMQSLERAVTALTVSSEARLEELRATFETRLKAQQEDWLRRAAELRAESDERLQQSAETAARALDEANLAVSQLQGFLHDRLSQALAVQHSQVNTVLERFDSFARQNAHQHDATRAALDQQLKGLVEEHDRKLANVLTSFQRQLEKALEGVVNRFTELDWLIRQMSESMVVLAKEMEDLPAVRDGVSAVRASLKEVASSCGATIDERLLRTGEEQTSRIDSALAELRHDFASRTEEFQIRLRELAAAIEGVASQLSSRPEPTPFPAAQFEAALEQFRDRLAEVADSLGRLRSVLEQRLAELGADQRAKLEILVAGLATLRQDSAETGRLLEQSLSRLQFETGTGRDQQHAELVRLLGDQSVLIERLMTEVSHLTAQLAEQSATDVRLRGLRELGRLVSVPSGNGDRVTWVPIDVVAPIDVYERLVQARAAADAEAVARAGNELETSILNAAAAMRRKYGALPDVADVAIMFLPVEGLYAEVLLRPALCHSLHRDYRVVIASPATLDSLLAEARTGERAVPVAPRAV